MSNVINFKKVESTSISDEELNKELQSFRDRIRFNIHNLLTYFEEENISCKEATISMQELIFQLIESKHVKQTDLEIGIQILDDLRKSPTEVH